MMLFFALANFYIVRACLSSAIEAMLNRTAISAEPYATTDECLGAFHNESIQSNDSQSQSNLPEGEFVWDHNTQDLSLYIFYFGSLPFHIPASFLARRYGSAMLLGCGSLFGSAMSLIIPIATQVGGVPALYTVRVLQGVIMSPVVPCTFDLLSKWIPPNERSRCIAFVNSSAQFGLLMSNQLSGFLSYTALGWPGIFYFFGSVATLWSVFFLFTVSEDPDSDTKIDPHERKLINKLIRGNRGNVVLRKSTTPSDRTKIFPIPFSKAFTCGPFYATFIAHVCSLTGFYAVVTLLPTYLYNIVHFQRQEANTMSCIPLFIMWIMVILTGWTSDHYLAKGFSRTRIRKLAVALGSFGPGITLLLSSYSSCLPGFNLTMLTISLSLTGVIYTSTNVNHLEISPRHAGLFMAITYSVGIAIALTCTYVWGSVVGMMETQQGWRTSFLSLSVIYFGTGIIFLIFASGELQQWGEEIEKKPRTQETTRTETVS